MDRLDAYIPMDRRLALSRGEALPDRTSGAALFADISGFTPLTEALARELGPQRGAEELGHHLNHIYGALIDAVHGSGGSVIGFSGDALTCWFDRDDGRRAAACGLAMQRIMSQLETLRTPAGGEFQIAIKVAVTAGMVRRFLVGEPRFQTLDVLAGAIMDRLAAAEHQAHPGEVVVSAETLQSFADQVVTRDWREDPPGTRVALVAGMTQPVPPAPWPADALVSDESARTWVLAPVYERLQSGQGQFLAELRPVVALFLKFGCIDYDGDDAAGDKLDAYIRWVQGIAARYDGSLLQLTMGDKGSYLYMAYGAPITHEDDAARAVAAALDLRSPPPELDFVQGHRIGVSKGAMLTGEYGAATHRTYGALGSEVNVAARLMTTAQAGQILVTKRIADEAGAGFEFQELEPILLKGVAQPMKVLAVRDKRREPATRALSRRAPAAMVGRENERAALAAQLHILREGRSGNLIIEGEAGIGKSRLVEFLVRQAHGLGIASLLGAGDAIERLSPYHAWRPVFVRLFDLELCGDEVSAGTREACHMRAIAHLETATPDLAHLAPLLNVVLPVDFPDSELTVHMTGEVRANNTRELLVALLNAAARAAGGPLLIVLEDAHWLDSASWALARLVSRHVHPALLVTVTRPLSDPLPAEYAYLHSAPDTRHLSLDTLPQADIEALVSQRLGVSGLPRPVADFIRGKAEGHPFFSEELAYALRDAGLIQIVDGECRLAPLGSAPDLRALDFPGTIQGVITSRIDRLPPEHQLAVKVASVIGRIFAFRALRDIHPVETDRPHLRAYLDTLARLDITPLEVPEPDLAYIFKHIITQEVAYSLMTFSQRRQLHRVVAEWYERVHADDLSPYYPLLAHHWSKAISDRDPEPEPAAKAIDYLEKAGELALRSYANQEAIGFFSEALALDKRLASGSRRLRRARWERQLGVAYLGVGQFGESRAHAEQALALLGQSVPATRGRLILSALGQVLRQAWHRLRPPRVERGMARSVPRPQLGMPSHHLPDEGPALRSPRAKRGGAGSAVEGALSEKQAIRLETARVFTDLNNLYYFANETGLLFHGILKALNQAEGLGPSAELAQAYGNMCVIAGLLQLHSLTETYSRLSQATAKMVGQIPTQVFVLLRINLYRSGVGHWQKAEEGLEEALALTERLGDRVTWIGAAAVMFLVLAREGKFARMAKLAAETRALAQRIGNPAFEVWGLNAQAYGTLLLGRADEALGLTEAALPLLSEAEESHRIAKLNVYGMLTKIRVYQGDMSSVKSAVEDLAPLVARSSPTAHSAFNPYDDLAEATLALWEAGSETLAKRGNSAAGQQDSASTLQELESHARQACKTLRRYARVFPIARPRALLRQGAADWLAGKPSQAHTSWKKALAAAEKLEMPYDRGLAHYAIGRHLAAGDPAREAHLNRARDIFAELGAAYDLARVTEASRGPAFGV